MTDNVTPLFPTTANRITAANSIYAPTPEPDPLDGWSTRALLATAAGLTVALCIIAVLP